MSRPRKYRVVSFTIPRELDDELERLRAKFGISKAELIRFFVIRGIEDIKRVTDELRKLTEG